MEEDFLARHERDGILRRSEAGYFCDVCPASLGQQPLPHLQGTKHTNAIFLLTLSNPSTYRERYRDIPERIRTSLAKGEIVVKEKKVMCTICDVPLSNEKTVNDHLLSSIHVTKVASRTTPAASSQPFSPRQVEQSPSFWSPHNHDESPPQPFRPLGAAQSPFTPPLVFDQSGLDHHAPSTSVERAESAVTHALRNGLIKIAGIDGFTCNVCGSGNVITGDVPMKQHLEGKPHMKNARKHELRHQQPSGALALHQPISPPSRIVDQFQVRRPSFVDQQQIPYHHQNPTHSQQNEFNYQPNSPHQQNPTHSQQNEFNYQPNSPHQQNPTHSQQDEFNYQSNSQHHQNPIHSQQNEFNYQQNPTHQQNVYQNQMSNQQQCNIVNAPSSVTVNVVVGGSQIPHPMYQREPSSHPAASSDLFSTNFKPRDGRRQPKSPYKIESSPRGIVVIFNYYFEGQGEYQRDGAAADYRNLREVFTNMDYEVWPENIDLTKQETMEKLDEIRSSQRLAIVDSFSIFFLTHGGDSPDSFRTVDGEIISVEEILYTKFTDANCPQLRRKPKMFFFNFCRGKTEQLQSDSWKPNSSSEIAPRHVAVIQAALPHFAAKRHIQKGTVFVDCLCEVLSESANSLDLHEIVQNTSELMQERGGTTATPWYIDFGKFYFL